MAKPRIWSISIILLLAALPLAAQAKDPSFVPADGLDNWDHDFDTSKLPPGTYNIVVQGTDAAGNAGIAGPLNILVDPAAALPHVSVINPTNLQRVGGDLIVVGTCVAEAGVSRVEVRIDAGEFQPAQGGEFWFLTIPTRDMAEGRKKLEIRGVDGNGLPGKSVTVTVDVDRTQPAVHVDSPPPGALVAGKVRLQGSVTSANGIATLAVSTDDARTYKPVSISRGKQLDQVTFSLELETTKFPDGPRIIWLRSRDRLGVNGSTPFLLFIANTKPAVQVRLPAKDAVVHGRFSVAGAFRSAIGVAKLGYLLEGGKLVDIPITPGDPYFALEFDAHDIKGDRANVIIVAQDRIGNVTRYPVSIRINHLADLPVLKVVSPAPAATMAASDIVWGSISADEGGAGVRVAVDGGKPSEFPATDVFSFPLPAGLASGRHVLTLQAKDGHGTWGNPVNLPVMVDAGPSSVKFLRLGSTRTGAGAPAAGDYAPGATFRATDGMFLEGSIASANPLAKASYSVAAGADRKLEVTRAAGNDLGFRIPLDRSLPYGFVPLEVRGQDTLGRNFSGRALVYSQDLSSAREDTGFLFDDPRIGSDRRVVLLPGDPLLGAFYREDIDSLRLEPPTDLVSLSFDGRTVSVDMARDGTTGPEQIVARTKRGHEFRTDPFVFVNGTADPSAAAPRFTGLAWVQGKTTTPWKPGLEVTFGGDSRLTGTVHVTGALASVEYRVGAGAAQKASLGKAAGGDVPFTCPLPSGAPYERVVVEVTARDAAGNEARRRVDFHNVLPPLSTAPASDTADSLRFFDDRLTDSGGGSLLTLASGDRLIGAWNGRPLKSVSMRPSTPLVEATLENGTVTLAAKAGGAATASDFRVHVETVDGDSFDSAPFRIVSRAAAPTVTLQGPQDGQWVRASVRISGTVDGPNGPFAIEQSINGGPFAALSGGSPAVGQTAVPIDVEVPLDQVADGPVRVDVRVRNASGDETVITRFLTKITTAPEVSQVYPVEDEEVTGPTTVIGQVAAAGHVSSIEFLPSKDGTPQGVAGSSVFSSRLDLARLPNPLPAGAGFLVTDRAGNQALFAPKLTVNADRGKPVVQIQTPADLEVVRSDFSISGTAFDYAGVAHITWRLDGGDWQTTDPKDAGFSIAEALASTTDNEHLFEAFAENIYGIKGDTASRKFRVSREEPRAVMAAPDITKPVRGVIEISGTATDANGIDSVAISFDNGATYVKADGAENWRYSLDTAILKDGLHAITIKPVDKYGTVGFSASLITVDNTPPGVQLAFPKDGETDFASVRLSGRASDNLRLAGVRVEVIPVGKDTPPALTVDLGKTGVVRQGVDVSTLVPGPYTVRVVARDGADNETFVSRDVVLSAVKLPDTVALATPVTGEQISGRLRVSGRAAIAGGATSVTILADGADVGTANLDSQGYFTFDIPAAQLADGAHAISARGVGANAAVVESHAAVIQWAVNGPWLTIDAPAFGKYLPDRPWLSGKAGWAIPAPDRADKAAVEAFNKSADTRKVRRIDVSLDNGRTFRPAGGNESWRFRLETQDYSEGDVFVLVRASFRDGSTVVARTQFNLDKLAPAVRVITPAENVHVGTHIHVAGTASDEESGLQAVSLALRKGDKHGYELPAFIQGLYLDGHFFGASTWDAGIGLSFFGDNVKLQGMYGQAPETDPDGNAQRFFGNVFSAKLIANVLYLPFSAFFGPDWDAFSASIGLGAEFSFFDMKGTTGGKGLSAVILQLEIPKYTIRGSSFLKKFSLYVEEQAWFIPSDVPDASSILLETTFGVRIGIF